MKSGRSLTVMHMDKKCVYIFPEYIQEKTHMNILANQALQQWKSTLQ